MKKLILIIALLTLFINVKGQDTIFVYQERGMIRVDDLEAVPILFTPNQVFYRITGSNFVLKDGISRKEYTIGAYNEIFDEDTTGFASNNAVINYLNGFISNYVNRDAITDAIMAIDYAHHEIHEGNAYSISTYDIDLDATDTMSISFTTPNTTKWFHMVGIMKNTSSSLAEVLEAPTITIDSGTNDTIYNKNRNNSNISGALSIETTPIQSKATIDGYITSDGSILSIEGIGVGKDKGTSESRAIAEIILKQNTTYSFRIIGIADNGNASIRLVWYEHINKN